MRIRRWIGRAMLRVLGWRAEGAPPDLPKYVLIGAPHTSNWDGVLMLAFSWALGLQLNWVAKHTLLRPPLGWLLAPLGAVGVDRQARRGFVQQMAEEFGRRDVLRLAIAPEGTRRWAPHWKSGFYHLALTAGVPVVPAYLDYGRKVAGFGPLLAPSGDVEADLEKLRAVYAGKPGRFPELAAPVTFEHKAPAG